MNLLPVTQTRQIAKKYALEFVKELRIGTEVEQRCEWTCLLWSKDHWANEARKTQITLQQTKERLTDSEQNARTVKTLFINSQFLNTVAQVYSKLFDGSEQSCSVREFYRLPVHGTASRPAHSRFIGERLCNNTPQGNALRHARQTPD